MKIMSILKTCILFLLLIGLFQCDKESITYYQISKETKDWIYFKKNSYWVYENESNNLTDRIVVENSSITKEYVLDPHDTEYYFDILLICYNSNNYYSLFEETMNTNSFLTRHYLADINYPYFDLNNNEIGVEYKFQNCTKTTLDHFDNYQVRQNEFKDVFLIQITDSINDRTNNYYLAKNIGIIKKEVFDSDSIIWDLIEWNIVQ